MSRSFLKRSLRKEVSPDTFNNQANACCKKVFYQKKLLAALLLFSFSFLHAADWPMYRYDTNRSAASPEDIAENPELLWSRKLPPVCPAWPLAKDSRSGFDSSYEPVVMGGALFVGSPNDGSITAYSTETGAEKWKFFTDGPVRCAPACWKGKLYAGSDDGYLYCLSAETGKVLWKFRGAPVERPDRRILGNEHLISFWPVRGGAVIKDGVLYFGAGIWPTFGVFIYALDAETGKVKWAQNDFNFIAKVRTDHDLLIESGLSPQGYFVATEDKLVVPCGRSMPAGLELSTGKLIYYTLGYYGKGDSHVAVCDDYVFAGSSAVLNTYDFRELGSRWAYRGNTPPKGYVEAAKRNHLAIPRGLLECPAVPYKRVKACNAYSAFSHGIAYGSYKGVFHAYDLKKVERIEQKMNWAGKKECLLLWQPKALWEFKIPGGGPKNAIVIKAGKRIYGYTNEKLVALENLGGPPSIAWKKKINGTPSSLVAADKKLFVVTKDGWIYCFGEGQSGKTYNEKPVALELKDDAVKEKVGKILGSTGVKSGYCIVQGIKDGRLIEALLKQSELIIIAVDEDLEKIKLLRDRFDKAGFLGSRVELFGGKPFEFLFPEYMASLMLAGNPLTAEQIEKTDLSKLYKILRPYGGVLCLEIADGVYGNFKQKVSDAKLANAVLKKSDGFLSLVRKGSLPGTASWTHDACDAANTLCLQDDLLKAPLGFLWFGDGNGCAQDTHAGNHVTTKVNGGRVYVLQQQRPRMLLAYDAYTGLPLWNNKFKSFFSFYVAMDDGIYLATGGKCFIYDPASGKPLKTFTFGSDGMTRVKGMKVDGDVILILCDTPDEKLEKKIRGKANDASWKSSFNYSTTLFCLDRKTGTELWKKEAKNRFVNRAFLVGDGIVFLIDIEPMSARGRRKQVGLENESLLSALDIRTGREIWSKKVTYKTNNRSYLDQAAYSPKTGVVMTSKNWLGSAFELKTGKSLWKNKDFKRATPLMVNGKEIIFQDGPIIDALTGARIRSWPRHYRFGCNYIIGSKNLISVRRSSACYIDLKTGKNYLLRNIRSGCKNSLVPGNGLLNSPNQSMVCSCGYAIRTSFAMTYMPEVEKWSGMSPVKMTPPPARPEMEAKIKWIQEEKSK